MNAHLTIAMNVKLVEQLDRLAKEAGVTRSALIREYTQAEAARRTAATASPCTDSRSTTGCTDTAVQP